MAEKFESDWGKMADMFPVDLPSSFSDLVKSLSIIDAVINKEKV